MAHLWFRAQHQEIAELEQQLRDTQAQLVSVERLQRCGGLDALTGLPDCSVFQTTLRREWNRARRDHVALSVLELSVSNLQAYNDRHGREAGDAVLKRVASELHSVAKRAGDSVARLLGTRFVAVLPNTSEDGATLVARRLRTKIEAAHTTSAADQPVVQVGVATMRAAALPTEPGVYLFKSSRGTVLYVGKAQNLRARVKQYVGGGDGRIRIPALMERAVEVDVLLTPTVKDALLLENELIKRHRPRFNVRLRDDKQYLALRLDSRETWPRLREVRKFARDGAEYFGPYTSSASMKEAVSHLRKIFPLRSCTEGAFKDYARRGRPCIEYEMKRCVGPCCGLSRSLITRTSCAGPRCSCAAVPTSSSSG